MIAALLLGLACGFVGSIPIAGPTSVLILERALARREVEAIEIGIGAAGAEALYACGAFLGMTAVLERLPWLVPASRILGAVILLGLGLYFALARRATSHEPPAPRKKGGKFVLGFAVTVVNPTLIATWSAVVTVLHGTGALRKVPLDAVPFAVGVGVGIAGWFAVMVALLAKFRSKFSDRTINHIVHAIGWLLAVGGAAMLVRLFFF